MLVLAMLAFAVRYPIFLLLAASRAEDSRRREGFMGKWIKTAAMLTGILALSIAGRQPARSQDFYQGKTITFIVGASPGGSLDTYTRLIGRHLGRYVPGNPSVIVQNMPGAGSMVAANHVYNLAKPDGLTIGGFAAAVVLQQVMGNQAAKFDGRKFGWTGTPIIYHSICIVRKESGITTIEDWLAAKRPPIIGGMGPGAGPSDTARILNAAIGLPLKLVEGYDGGAAVRLALERGEIDGYCGSWQDVSRVWPDALRAGKFVVVIQASVETHPDLTQVPLAIHYAKSEEAKQLLNVNDTIHGFEFVYATPPGTLKERLQILRTAFMQALRSPELVAEAKKTGLEIDPVDGGTIAKKLDALYDLPASTVSKLEEVLVPR
jgi:tripartite-type tricarboxylate transporter receptor subunit TctC